MPNVLPPEYADAGGYAGGEFGARRVLDAGGNPYVFKAQPPGLAPATTESLKALGYPAPLYVAWGDDWCIQEELPGEPIGQWGAPLPPRLLALNELQTGRAVDDDTSWPAAAVAWTIGGHDDYMFVVELEGHSEEARELVRRCRGIVERHAGDLRAARDVVHWDLTAANVLARDGEVTGVIDWNGTRSGDRLFDLATWLYYGPDEALKEYLVERIGEGGLAVYLAHMAIRQAGWSVYKHPPEAGWAMVRYGLRTVTNGT